MGRPPKKTNDTFNQFGIGCIDWCIDHAGHPIPRTIHSPAEIAATAAEARMMFNKIKEMLQSEGKINKLQQRQETR